MRGIAYSFVIAFLIAFALSPVASADGIRTSYGYINLDLKQGHDFLYVTEGYTIENGEPTNITELAFHLPFRIDYSLFALSIDGVRWYSYTNMGRMLVVNLTSKPVLPGGKVNAVFSYPIELDDAVTYEKSLTYNTSMLIINLTMPSGWRVKDSTATFTESSKGVYISMPPLANKEKHYQISIVLEKTVKNDDSLPTPIVAGIISGLIGLCASTVYVVARSRNWKKDDPEMSRERKLRKMKATIHKLDESYDRGMLDKETYKQLRREYKDKALELMAEQKKKSKRKNK